jgi:putative transposase
MTRTQRIDQPNAVQRIRQRGIERQPLFEGADDYSLFLQTLREVADRYGWEVLSYCLVPNRVDLLVRTTRPTLSLGMRRLKGAYARRFNLAHGYTGPAFAGRFESEKIEAQDEQQAAFAAIALDPVRSGLCREPEHWRWSAHTELLGDGGPVTATHSGALEVFGPRAATARRRYAALVARYALAAE